MRRLVGCLVGCLVACASPHAPPVRTPPRPSAAPGAPAAAPPALAKAHRVRTIEGITEYRLDNGLVVLLFPDPTQSTVTINVTYLVGSRVEGYGETGMAHLLEHMLFKGTERYTDIGKVLDAKGAQEDASTWTDRTNYFETLPASQDNLDFALDLEADRMIHSRIDPKDLASEFSVVRNELEKDENDVLSLLEQRIIATAYLWHNYGKDTIGSRTDIERVPASSLKRFYAKYYQPDNAVLVVSGKLDEAAALASIERTFGAIPRPARVLEPTYTVEPVQDGERSVVLRRNGDIAAVGVAYHTVGAASPDYPAVQAALGILTREPSGRLYKKLVETQLAASVDGNQLAFRDPFLAIVTAEVRDPGKLAQVEAILTAEIEGLGTAKLTEKELERWRAATAKRLELAMTNSQTLALELSEFAALGDWRTLFAYRDRVEKVTLADVHRVAAAFFKSSNRTSGRFIPTPAPDRAPLVETPDVAAVVRGIEGGTVKHAGAPFTATLDTIEASTRRMELAGGIKAALLPKQTRGGRVHLELTLHYGDAKTLQGKTMAGELAVAMLERGTQHRSYEDVRDEIDQLHSVIGIAGGPTTCVLDIDTLRDRLAGALALGAEMLKEPRFEAKQLELVKQELLASLEQERQDPAVVAGAVLAQLTSRWPKTDPRYPMTPDEQIAAIKAVTLADVIAFHRLFVGAGHAELAVVGDFDPAAIGAQAAQLFGRWISKAPYTRLDGKVFDVPATAKSIDIKDKEMTQLVLHHDVAMRDTDADYPAWEVLGQLLGGDSGARLWLRLREREGLTYSVSAWTYAGSLDDAGGFGAELIVAPQNLAKARAALLEELARVASQPAITADELVRAKDGWIKQQDTSLSSDRYVVAMLSNQLYRGRTTAFMKALRAKIQALAIADLERVARQYLHPDKLVIVDAGDASKAK